MVVPALSSLFFLFCVLLCAYPLGGYIAKVIVDPQKTVYSKPFRWIEAQFSKYLHASYTCEMTWREYFLSYLAFHLGGMVVLFLLSRYQEIFSFLGQKAPNFSAYEACNFAISFCTNTDIQNYIPELKMSNALQTIGVTVQQFFSASVGACLLFVLGRAFRAEDESCIGNFWRDLVRFSVYILLPLSIVMATFFIATGIPQTLHSSISYTSLEGNFEKIPSGLTASCVAIKQLGTNGGGFYNVNGAHPLENPSILSHLLQMFCILLIPIALVRTYAILVGSERQAYVLFSAMGIIFVCSLFAICMAAIDFSAISSYKDLPSIMGENLEGKECRFGSFWSIFWTVCATATSNGSTCCSISSFLPLVSGIPLAFMQSGEVIFGGLGTGVVSAVALLLIAVFTAGLMVGRSPEYLGKKIGAREMKFVTLLVILPAILTLLFSSFALHGNKEAIAISENTLHAVSETVYAYTSASGNNGSTFGLMNMNTDFYNLSLACVMFITRIFSAALICALAASIAKKKKVAESIGSLSTETGAFVLWFCFVIVIVGALSYLPAFTLGPIMEHLFFMY